MEVVRTLPSKALSHFVVEPILRDKYKIGDVTIQLVNKADSKVNRATEGIVRKVPSKKIWADPLLALRMELIGPNEKYEKPIMLSVEEIGVKEGDIVGYHYNQVDTIGLDGDEYLFINPESLLYVRNDDGLRGLMGWVIMEKIEKPRVMKSGIELKKGFYDDRYKVIATPIGFFDAEPGDEVLIRNNGGSLVIHTYIDGKEYVRAAQNNIYAKYE